MRRKKEEEEGDDVRKMSTLFSSRGEEREREREEENEDALPPFRLSGN